MRAKAAERLGQTRSDFLRAVVGTDAPAAALTRRFRAL